MLDTELKIHIFSYVMFDLDQHVYQWQTFDESLDPLYNSFDKGIDKWSDIVRKRNNMINMKGICNPINTRFSVSLIMVAISTGPSWH